MSKPLDEEYWEGIRAPNKILPINRKVLWSIWAIITATPFELREEHWEHASKEVKRLLREE